LQFHLKNLAPAQIVGYLKTVLASEQIDYEEDALWQLARAAGGSMRDALTLLDQSISYGGGRVESISVASLLGTPDFTLIFLLIEALASRNPMEIVRLQGIAAENNPDYQRLLEHMLSVFYRITLAQLVPEAVDNSEGDRDRVIGLAASLSPEDAQLYYQIGLQALQELMVSPDRKMSFNMALLRMYAFSPDVFMARDADTEQKKKPELTQSTVDLQSVKPPDIAITDDAEPIKSAVKPDVIDWYKLVSECGLSGISGNILWNCVPASAESDRFVLVLDQQQSALYSSEHAEIIAHALSESLGRSVGVEISIGPVAAETPAERRRREKAAAIEALHQRFYQDVGVMALVAGFDAKIDDDSLEISRVTLS
jgi:DNA polymerase-3 subunit gamma/tau